MKTKIFPVLSILFCLFSCAHQKPSSTNHHQKHDQNFSFEKSTPGRGLAEIPLIQKHFEDAMDNDQFIILNHRQAKDGYRPLVFVDSKYFNPGLSILGKGIMYELFYVNSQTKGIRYLTLTYVPSSDPSGKDSTVQLADKDPKELTSDNPLYKSFDKLGIFKLEGVAFIVPK